MIITDPPCPFLAASRGRAALRAYRRRASRAQRAPRDDAQFSPSPPTVGGDVAGARCSHSARLSLSTDAQEQTSRGIRRRLQLAEAEARPSMVRGYTASTVCTFNSRHASLTATLTAPVVRRILVFIAVALLINWNSSRVRITSTGLGGSKTLNNIAKGGYARFASGGSVTTAAAQQGANQCVSIHKSDTPTAQCQTFCNDKFKKFHCVWCKCRACDFCPKGGEAITEAAKEAPPPSPPPPPYGSDDPESDPDLGFPGADASLDSLEADVNSSLAPLATANPATFATTNSSDATALLPLTPRLPKANDPFSTGATTHNASASMRKVDLAMMGLQRALNATARTERIAAVLLTANASAASSAASTTSSTANALQEQKVPESEPAIAAASQDADIPDEDDDDDDDEEEDDVSMMNEQALQKLQTDEPAAAA